MLYRVRQFWWNLTYDMDEKDIEFVKLHLDELEQGLFFRLGRNEQKHCVNVAATLLKKYGRCDKLKSKSLIRLGLLHDVGKVYRRLNVVEKSIMVLADKFSGSRIRRFKNIKMIDIYYNHAEKGFDLLKDRDYDKEFLDAIRYHHTRNINDGDDSIGDNLLYLLKCSDEEC